jgi:hypothetical protein
MLTKTTKFACIVGPQLGKDSCLSLLQSITQKVSIVNIISQLLYSDRVTQTDHIKRSLQFCLGFKSINIEELKS